MKRVLSGMQRKPKPAKTFPQHLQNPLGVVMGLEGHHEVIGEPDKNRSPPSGVALTSLSNHASSTWCRKMFESMVR